MVDDVALRNRRNYRHRKGDHSLCRPQRCDKAPGAMLRISPSVQSGVIEAYRAGLEAAGRLNSPGGELVILLATRLVEGTHTASALASLSRELRAAYDAAVKDAETESADVIDGIFKTA